jgi:tetratricopeptide (TPR) repeat protein
LRADSITVALCVQHFRRLGDPAACRAAAAALEKKDPADAVSRYNAACCRALTAAAQAKAGGADAARLAKEEADRAMAWLTKAVAAGFDDLIGLGSDDDLDPLRDREDFRKLLADQVAKAPPVANARYHILLSEWDKAAAAYAKADWSGPLDDDAVSYAGLFLLRGDGEGYNRFCQDMIRRVVATEAPAPRQACLLARSCALACKSPVDPAQAVEWANQAVANDPSPWRFHFLGLAQYRAGQSDEALQSFTKATVASWKDADLNWFGLALVHHRLGKPDEARRCLDKGIRWLERVGPAGPERPAQLQPQDWLEAQVLRREAEEMLKIKRTP